MLRTTKNAVIASHIDASCAIPSLEGRASCTVKGIPLSDANFAPHGDFEQHRTPNPAPLKVVLISPLITDLNAARQIGFR